MAYFRKFPKVLYRFGNNEEPVAFQILNTYVDIISSVSDDIQIYEKHTIQPGDRPDTLSFDLYGSVDHYWTFFLANNHLRESGWPLSFQDLYDQAKLNYPHMVFSTNTNISNTQFKIGETVTASQSGTTGVIVEVSQDLGQVTVDTSGNFAPGESVSVGSGGEVETAIVLANYLQYDSIHHYNDSTGSYTDIDPYTHDVTGYIPVTYMDRMIALNDTQSQINILTPKSLKQVVSQVNKLLRNK